MPANHDDDVELSALLNQVEPPKSPRHLDDAILKYASQQANAAKTTGGDGFAFLNINWLQQNWLSAAATLSVAVIAVSVSLQIFTDPNLTSSSTAGLDELAFSEPTLLKQEDSAEFVTELEERTATAAQAVTRNEAALSLAVADPPAPPAAPERAAAADANFSQLAAPIAVGSSASIEERRQVSAAQANANQVLAQSDADIPSAEIEEVVVTGAFVRRATASAASAVQEPQSVLSRSINEDSALQETVVIVLRRSLGVGVQIAEADQQEFSAQISPLINAYRQLSEPAILANSQDLYREASAERPDPRLPESLEELVAVLEAL